MYKYSNSSLSKLKECHPDLIKIFEYVIQHFDNTITEGHRGEEEQEFYYQKGKSKVKYPNSNHNKTPSLAIDSIPYPINYDDKQTISYFAGFVMGVAAFMKDTAYITNTLRWGGDWHMKNIADGWDMPHFEIINFGIHDDD